MFERTTMISTRARLQSLGLLGAAAIAAGIGRAGIAAAQDDIEPATIRRPLTIFVGGLDSREPDQPENTDVLILARVDLQNASVRAISVPRDLYLEIPGYGYDKITRAYDYGSKADNSSFRAGAQLIAETVALNFGLELDGTVLTTFDGFIQIVDALGGIDVVNPYDLYDSQYPTRDYGYKEIYYPAGELHLSGEEALEFSRTRHQDGDDGRVMRQQIVIRALLERARSAELAAALPEIVFANEDAVRTNLGPSKRLALALAAPNFSNDNLLFATLNDYIYPDTAPGGMWIYSGDWSQIPGFIEGFLSGAF